MPIEPTPTFRCPQCGHVYVWEAAQVGKVITCRECRIRLKVSSTPKSPVATAKSTAPAIPLPTVAPPPPAPQSPPPFGVPPDDDSEEIELDEADETNEPQITFTRPRTPLREPWFIRFLEGYTLIVMWIGIVIVTCGGIAAVVLFLGAMATSDQDPLAPSKTTLLIGFAVNVVSLFGALIAILFSAAVILLAVDATRNLRALVDQGRRR